jgi:hypothetical protein
MFKAKRILFWIKDDAPTLDERVIALSYGPGVTFRNARIPVPVGGSIERCDAVTAIDVEVIPARYRETYPVLERPEDLAKLYEAEFANMREAKAAATAAQSIITAGKAQAEKMAATAREALAEAQDGEKPPQATKAPTKGAKAPQAPATPPAWAPNS